MCIRVTGVEKNVLKKLSNVRSADAGRMRPALVWTRRCWGSGAARIKTSCVSHVHSQTTDTILRKLWKGSYSASLYCCLSLVLLLTPTGIHIRASMSAVEPY